MTDSNGHDLPNATVNDVVEHFGVSERTVRRWLKSTDMPHRRVGGVIRFAINEVDEWMQTRARGVPEAPPAPCDDDPIYKHTKADAAKQERRAS